MLGINQLNIHSQEQQSLLNSLPQSLSRPYRKDNINTLRTEIYKNYQKSKQLDPDTFTFKEYLYKTVHFSEDFLNQINQKKTYQQENKEYFEQNNERLKITHQKESFDSILEIFDNSIAKQGFFIGHPGFMGYFSGGGIQTAAIAEYLNQLVNPQTCQKKANPGAHQIEKYLIQWTASLIGYPIENCGGNFTTGGSMSHLSAVCTARDAQNISCKDYDRCVVYVTAQTHLSFKKSLNVAGMRECLVRIIQIDPNTYKMDCQNLKLQIKIDIEKGLLPFMIIGSAGATSTGQIDPLDQIGPICQENHIWFHVDGAYGGFFAICEEGKRKLKGIEMADSIILDPHKTLSLPLGLGLVMVKNIKYLQKTFGSEEAYYLQDSTTGEELDYPEAKDLSNELSRTCRAFKLWMALKLHGVECFVANLQEKLLLTRYFVQKIQQIPNVKVVMNPDLTTACFRYDSEQIECKEQLNQINRRLNQMIQQDGEILLSSTVLDGYVTLRIAILAFRTHIEQVDICIDNLSQCVQRINQEFQ